MKQIALKGNILLFYFTCIRLIVWFVSKARRAAKCGKHRLCLRMIFLTTSFGGSNEHLIIWSPFRVSWCSNLKALTCQFVCSFQNFLGLLKIATLPFLRIVIPLHPLLLKTEEELCSARRNISSSVQRLSLNKSLLFVRWMPERALKDLFEYTWHLWRFKRDKSSSQR